MVDSNPFRFSSKYQDSEAGLLYYGYRCYNPIDGRWLNRGPIGMRGGLNIYGFVKNRPSKRIDFLGLFVEEDITPGAVAAELEMLLNAFGKSVPYSGPGYNPNSNPWDAPYSPPGDPLPEAPKKDPSREPIYQYSDDPPSISDASTPVIYRPGPRPKPNSDPETSSSKNPRYLEMMYHYSSTDLTGSILWIESHTTHQEVNECALAAQYTGAKLSKNCPCYRCLVTGPRSAFKSIGTVGPHINGGGGADNWIVVVSGAVAVHGCQKIPWLSK